MTENKEIKTVGDLMAILEKYPKDATLVVECQRGRRKITDISYLFKKNDVELWTREQ